MRILIADDEVVSRRMLQASATQWGYEPVLAVSGTEAWGILQSACPPPLAILDWLMPGLDGIEICRRARETPSLRRLYILLLTSRTGTGDLVQGLEAGADDYVTKPFEPAELRARIRVGERLVQLQSQLAERVVELESALNQLRELRGLLPICAYCKKVRDDHNYWHQVESYIEQNTQLQCTHGICPECLARLAAEVDVLATREQGS